jgi:hypothetical protein
VADEGAARQAGAPLGGAAAPPAAGRGPRRARRGAAAGLAMLSHAQFASLVWPKLAAQAAKGLPPGAPPLSPTLVFQEIMSFLRVRGAGSLCVGGGRVGVCVLVELVWLYVIVYVCVRASVANKGNMRAVAAGAIPRPAPAPPLCLRQGSAEAVRSHQGTLGLEAYLALGSKRATAFRRAGGLRRRDGGLTAA